MMTMRPGGLAKWHPGGRVAAWLLAKWLQL